METRKKIAITLAAALAATTLTAATVTTTVVRADDEEIAQAYFIGSVGTNGNWATSGDKHDEGAAITSITDDGTYTVTWDMAATIAGNSWFLAVVITPTGSTENFTTDTFENLEVTLDSVSVDGTEIEDLSGAVINMAYYDKDLGAGITRIYLHDDWAGTGASAIENGITIGDDYTNGNITATFTISGTDLSGDDDSSSEDSSSTDDSSSSSEDSSTSDDSTSSDDSSADDDASTDASGADVATGTTDVDVATDTTDIATGVTLLGDADGDGEVGINDAYVTLNYYATKTAYGDEITEDELNEIIPVDYQANADVDEDGAITINDASYILTYYATRVATGEEPAWEDIIPAEETEEETTEEDTSATDSEEDTTEEDSTASEEEDTDDTTEEETTEESSASEE